MKIEVYNPVDEHRGRKPVLAMNDDRDWHHIRVTVQGDTFDISADGGLLQIRHVEGGTLLIRPVASNTIDVFHHRTEAPIGG